MTRAVPRVTFTRDGIRRGMRACVPLLIGMLPFGLVTGILAHGAGLSLLEATAMSLFVYAGSAQLVVLANWTHPASVLAAAATAFAVNLRMALMGPVLAPWLDRMRGWRLWGSLYVMADQNWALSVKDMNAGRMDVGFLFGSGAITWATWVLTTIAGWLVTAVVRLPPGHPVFFAALAVFVAMLAMIWRGAHDILPWAVAAVVASLAARALPGTSWYIIAGALSGSLAGGVRDRIRA